eukprot:m.95037 g.95037  ORF g.95037 m.95037 type:complete len:232 (+) comp15139_c0_seq4:123-818(+)
MALVPPLRFAAVVSALAAEEPQPQPQRQRRAGPARSLFKSATQAPQPAGAQQQQQQQEGAQHQNGPDSAGPQVIYRSSSPSTRNFPFLRTLQLRTVVSLTPKQDQPLAEFCRSEGISLRHIAVKSGDGVTVSHSQVAEFIELVARRETLPLLVHCADGSQCTGLVVMVLRKVQMYSNAYAIAEFLRFDKWERDKEGDGFVCVCGGSGEQPFAICCFCPSFLFAHVIALFKQ